MKNDAKIFLSVKLAYTAFVAVLVPYYWMTYGPTNFLYFCDVALLLTLIAIWTENRLLASMPTVGIVLPQLLWQVDFLGSAFGMPVIGMTAYMFDEKIPLFARGLSFFHFWLPLLLLWLVFRLGYDPRALKNWTALAWCLMIVCYAAMPAPPAPAEYPNLPVNINYVHGLSDAAPQTWLPPIAYLATMMVALPLIIFFPTHFALKKLAPPRDVPNPPQ